MFFDGVRNVFVPSATAGYADVVRTPARTAVTMIRRTGPA